MSEATDVGTQVVPDAAGVENTTQTTVSEPTPRTERKFTSLMSNLTEDEKIALEEAKVITLTGPLGVIDVLSLGLGEDTQYYVKLGLLGDIANITDGWTAWFETPVGDEDPPEPNYVIPLTLFPAIPASKNDAGETLPEVPEQWGYKLTNTMDRLALEHFAHTLVSPNGYAYSDFDEVVMFVSAKLEAHPAWKNGDEEDTYDEEGFVWSWIPNVKVGNRGWRTLQKEILNKAAEFKLEASFDAFQCTTKEKATHQLSDEQFFLCLEFLGELPEKQAAPPPPPRRGPRRPSDLTKAKIAQAPPGGVVGTTASVPTPGTPAQPKPPTGPVAKGPPSGVPKPGRVGGPPRLTPPKLRGGTD